MNRAERLLTRLLPMLLCVVLTGCSGLFRPRALLLTRDGRPMATIVVPDVPLSACDNSGNGTLTQRTAAEELQKYLAKVSGATLPVVAAAQAPAKGTLLLVGRSRLSDQFGLSLPSRPEGLRIVSFPRGVAILGEIADARVAANNTGRDLDRGIMHAVYTFLERYAGCRFYFAAPEDAELGTVIPANPTLAVPIPLDDSDAPVFAQRESRLVALAATRAGNADRRVAGHTHGEYWARCYRESHPEYFMLQPDGRRNFKFLCYSEPGVLEAELRHIEEWYAGRRDSAFGSRIPGRFIPVWPDDLFPAHGCGCAHCRKQMKPGYDGKWSNLWWDYVRRLAEEVARRWPDKRVVTGAYTTWLLPPDFPLPDNVCVELCIHPGGEKSHTHTFLNKQPEIYARNLSLVAAWHAKLNQDPDRLHTREYGLADSHTGMPVLYPHTLQRWLQEVRPWCRGTYFDGIYGASNTPVTYLMTWLQFRLLWNPDLPVDAAVAEHCRAFFGAAGDAMAAFHRLLIERYEQPWPWKDVQALSGLGYSITMLYGQTYPPEVLDCLEELLQSAAGALALAADPDWTVRSNSAWIVRNTAATPRSVPVSFAPVNGVVSQPTLRWDDGEIVYRGELKSGQRLLIQPDRTARLFAADGAAVEVTDRIRGELPVVAPRRTTVVHYSSPEADPRDLVRVAMGATALAGMAPATLNIQQRRLQWLRRHLEVHTLGWGRYSSPDGPLVLGRMTQNWVQHGVPAYPVPMATPPPAADPEATCWQTAGTIRLIQGSPNPQNADLNVGFPADLATQVRMLQDADNLYVLFRCTQFTLPSPETDGVVVRLYRGTDEPVLELAVRPEGTLYPAPPFKPWEKANYGLDTAGVRVQAMHHFPPVRSVTVRPSQAATVRRDTRQNLGARQLHAGHMPAAGGLTVQESYVQFDVPRLDDDERILQAWFYGYRQAHLSAHHPTGVLVSYAADDDWTTRTATFARLLPLAEAVAAIPADRPDEQGRGWFRADIRRWLRRDGEGPGRPLTLGITAAPYQGMRGFALSMAEENELAPYLRLETGKTGLANDPWWSVLISIPKDKIRGNRPLQELRADLARIHGDRHFQWTPALAYIWTYDFPVQRRGRVLLER